MSRDQALSKIDNYFKNGEFEAELARRIGLSTVSTLAGCGAALLAYLDDERVPCVADLGFTCEIFPNPRADAGPFLVARRIEGDDLPTVMTYGH
ncbi:MAG: M20 peptidase family dipeptidase, partial [Candidatus Puniceispirillum sp.]